MAKIETDIFSWLKYATQEFIYDSDVGSSVLFFGMADLPTIEIKDSEIEYIVEKKDRIDTIAHKFYGNAALWWVIALRNEMGLPDEEIYEGARIVIPHPDYIFEIIG